MHSNNSSVPEIKQAYRWLRRDCRPLIAIPGLALAFFFATSCLSDTAPQRTAVYNREHRIRTSPNWKDGKFFNTLEERNDVDWRTTWEFLTGGENREPAVEPPFLKRTAVPTGKWIAGHLVGAFHPIA